MSEIARIKCIPLNLNITREWCDTAIKFGHHYCHGCKRIRNKPYGVLKSENNKYHDLLVKMIEDAIKSIMNNHDIIYGRIRYWMKNINTLSKRRAEFVNDIEYIKKLQEGWRESIQWMFLSKKRNEGSFHWVCFNLHTDGLEFKNRVIKKLEEKFNE